MNFTDCQANSDKCRPDSPDLAQLRLCYDVHRIGVLTEGRVAVEEACADLDCGEAAVGGNVQDGWAFEESSSA